MHVITGVSALQVIRCIRSQGVPASLRWFPEVENPPQNIRLDASSNQLQIESTPCVNESTNLFDETLQDASFPFDECVSNKRVDVAYIDGCELLGFRKHLELGVFDIKRRAYRETLRTRLLRDDLPAKSFIWAGKETCFASPEYMITQLAAQLDAIKLAQIIMEMTGYFTLPPENNKRQNREGDPTSSTVYNLPPVTTLARIRAFSQHVRMMRGKPTLEAALNIALEHSASPIESILAIAFRLPLQDGGYGMETPLLNPCIERPRELREFVSQDKYHPDIFFPGAQADLEYESTTFHLDPVTANWAPGEFKLWRAAQSHKAASDRRRARELEALGLRVIPVVWDDLINSAKLDKIAWLLARRMEERKLLDATAYMQKLETYELRTAREQLLETLLS